MKTSTFFFSNMGKKRKVTQTSAAPLHHLCGASAAPQRRVSVSGRIAEPAVISAETPFLSAKCSGAISPGSGPKEGNKACKTHFSTSFASRLSKRRPLYLPSGFAIYLAQASLIPLGKHFR